MQRKEGTSKHGVRKQRDLWEDTEMVPENGKMRSMQGAEIQSQTDRQGNRAGWRQRSRSAHTEGDTERQVAVTQQSTVMGKEMKRSQASAATHTAGKEASRWERCTGETRET